MPADAGEAGHGPKSDAHANCGNHEKYGKGWLRAPASWALIGGSAPMDMARLIRRRLLMKKLSLLGLVVGTALLAAAPVSIQPSPKSVVEVSLNKADARYGDYRRPYRRPYRRSYYRYGYEVGSEYYYKYPSGFPISYYGYGYSAYSAGYAPLGIRDNWGAWDGLPLW
jgi:hypothetical protein